MGFVVANFIHIGAVALAFGGVAVMLWALMPALGKIDAEAAAALAGLVGRRFRWMIWTVIVLIVGSGVYMLLSRLGGSAFYQTILGIKILLALAVFAVALGLTLPLKRLEGMQKKRRRWMIINVHLIAIVIFLGVWLRRL